MMTLSSRSVRSGVSPTMEKWRKASEVDRHATNHELFVLGCPLYRRASSYVEINRLIEMRCKSLSPSAAMSQNPNAASNLRQESRGAQQAHSSLSSDGIFRR